MNKNSIKEKIILDCIKDRNIAYENKKMGWCKKYYLDIYLKFLILMFNSIGKYESRKNNICFVNEIKNKNMSDNLLNTYKEAKYYKKDTKWLCFYQINIREHYKIGFVLPLVMSIQATVKVMEAAIRGWKEDKFEKYIVESLVDMFIKYISILGKDDNTFYLMTDHHFFSSILANQLSSKCYVLQHGMVLNKRLYYPVRANVFYAWGRRSKEILENDEKIIVVGTYKFKGMYNKFKKRKITKVLYCISILDDELVKKKIEVLYEITQKNGFLFAIKLHPGSMFDISFANMIENKNISIYKEEDLSSIDFDLAVTENSTINIDLAVMGKPFIIYDFDNGYFNKYFDIIPHGNSFKELEECFQRLDFYDFKLINEKLLINEVNGGRCTLFE